MLRIWQEDPYSGSPLSQDGSLTSPLIFKISSNTGGESEVQLWLRHDELSGELAEASYTVTVEGADDFDTDESGWITIAPDASGTPGAYVSQLVVGDILAGQVYPFWVKATVPASGGAGVRTDIYLKVVASSTAQTKDLRLENGSVYNCTYNTELQSIDFDTINSEGNFLSEWVDISAYDLTGITYDIDGSVAQVDYRTSTDGTEATATAWAGTVGELDLTKNYLQVRVRFSPSSSATTTGLVRRIYGNTDFSVYKTTTEGGVIPTSSTPGDSFPAPKSIKWTGFFKAVTSGLYNFRTVSNDGHRLYINEDLVHENWTTTSSTVTSNGNVFLNAGWHYVEYHYYHADGDDTISSFVTPPSSVERAVTLSDFRITEQVIRVNAITLVYSGPNTFAFDMQMYDGPDVPELIAPENGFETELFSPELTVYTRNCEYVEFQMDMDTTFATPTLVTWIDPVVAETEHVTTAPTGGSRPPGIWYWRARGILNGVYSEWSDWRFLEILPLVTNDEFLYLNTNVSLQAHDPIEDDRFEYVNVNVGLKTHDPIIDDRFIYQNVYVDLAIGKIIYPLYDDTPTRKREFEGDDEFITDDGDGSSV